MSRQRRGNVIRGNYIGLNAAGNALGNSESGIDIASGANGNTIGGITASARNVISANAVSGIDISDAGTNGNVILGNYIGTDAGGTLDRGNAGDGVHVFGGATGTVIGGSVAGAGNLISGNNAAGVRLESSTAPSCRATASAPTPPGRARSAMSFRASW